MNQRLLLIALFCTVVASASLGASVTVGAAAAAEPAVSANPSLSVIGRAPAFTLRDANGDGKFEVVERFDLPHHHGPDSVLHLMSVISPIADDLALVFEPLAPVPLLETLDERAIRRVRCHPDEFERQGCNALAVRPGVLIMADTCPETRRDLERAGCEVHVYAAAELNKGHGGPTCLTRPVLRG